MSKIEVLKRLGGKLVTQVPKDETAAAERARKLATKKRKDKKNKQNAITTQKKGKVGNLITPESIKQAKTAIGFTKLQRRIDDMPDGARKKMMQKLLDRQEKEFEAMQKAEDIKATDKRTSGSRDATVNKKENVTLPKAPFDYYKGGMANKKKKKKKPSYNKGGYVNCGASNPGTQKRN